MSQYALCFKQAWFSKHLVRAYYLELYFLALQCKTTYNILWYYCVELTENTIKGNVAEGCSVELLLEALSNGYPNGTRTVEIE